MRCRVQRSTGARISDRPFTVLLHLQGEAWRSLSRPARLATNCDLLPAFTVNASATSGELNGLTRAAKMGWPNLPLRRRTAPPATTSVTLEDGGMERCGVCPGPSSVLAGRAACSRVGRLLRIPDCSAGCWSRRGRPRFRPSTGRRCRRRRRLAAHRLSACPTPLLVACLPAGRAAWAASWGGSSRTSGPRPTAASRSTRRSATASTWPRWWRQAGASRDSFALLCLVGVLQTIVERLAGINQLHVGMCCGQACCGVGGSMPCRQVWQPRQLSCVLASFAGRLMQPHPAAEHLRP